MSVTEVFARVGAPLKNQRWSWGAVRDRDGAVFLRVWQDQGTKVDGKYLTQLTYAGIEPGNIGFSERLGHVERVRAGALCYLIMCEAKDVNAIPRDIKSANEHEVFVGGDLREIDGNVWIERVGRLAIKDVLLTT